MYFINPRSRVGLLRLELLSLGCGITCVAFFCGRFGQWRDHSFGCDENNRQVVVHVVPATVCFRAAWHVVHVPACVLPEVILYRVDAKINLLRVVVRGVLISFVLHACCLLYTSPSPRDLSTSRMPSSA